MEINEKLDIFFRAAIEAANNQSEEILEEHQRIYQNSLAEYEKKVQAKQKIRERMGAEQVEKKVNRTVSEQVVLLKKEYNDKQQALKEELFALVEDKLRNYQKTNDYRIFLADKIKRAKAFAGEAEITIYLNPSDAALQKELEQETGCVLSISEQDFGGGIRAVIRSKNVLIDESFTSKLMEEKEAYSF